MLAVAALALSAGSAFAKDIQNLVLTTNPQMHCQNCEARIKNHLKFEKGVKKIQTSVENQTVTITYDADKTSEKALMGAFSKINYEVMKVDSQTNQATPASQKATACPEGTTCH